jgi:hypothetical protein
MKEDNKWHKTPKKTSRLQKDPVKPTIALFFLRAKVLLGFLFFIFSDKRSEHD